MKQRWAVIFNCQSEGLASSVDCLARNVDCTPYSPGDFKRHIAEDPDYFRRYDFAIVSVETANWAGDQAYRLPAHITLPSFRFSAYHPDIIYVLVDGVPIKSRLGDYHSMIALAAYKEGLSAVQAAAFFNRRTYEIAGYLDQWAPFRDALIARYRDAGIDVAPIFVRRSRGAPFMHTINHPKIEILFDVARLVLDKLDQPIFADVEPPPDRLAGLSWPVYPEIGAQFGVPGSYLFKPLGQNKPLELVPYLEESLALFARWNRSHLRVTRALQPQLQHIRAEMRSGR